MALDDDAAVETGHRCVGELLKESDWRGAESAAGPAHAVDSLDFATLVTWPEKTICVGLNYLDHIAETGRTPPEYPTLFTKYARSLIGAFDPIQMPRDDESVEVDWEAELGVVIGTEVRRGSKTRRRRRSPATRSSTTSASATGSTAARSSCRARRGRAARRSAPTSSPPSRAPAAFPISCVVDGQVMQNSNTGELCFGPVHLVQYISTLITLAPGDLIVTGTPGGVGHARNPKVFLQRGQTVVTRIEGIGECRNVCA